MSPLVCFALTLRRGLRIVLPVLGVLGGAGLVLLDALDPMALPYALVCFAVLGAVLVRRLRRRMRSIDVSFMGDLDLGLLGMLAAYALVVRIDGHFEGSSFPVVFVTLALISAVIRPSATLIVLFGCIALEASVRAVAFGEPALTSVAPHATFMAIFAGFNAAVLRTEIARIRKACRTQLDDEIGRLREDARSYRLLGAHTQKEQTQGRSEELLARSGVEEIHQSVLFALRLLRESLGLHTALLLWKNDAGTHLRISELASDARAIAEGPFAAGDGIFGAAMERGAAVSISGLKASYKLPYYHGPCPVASVCALPVLEGRTNRGVLVVDRLDDRPFTAREEQLIEEAARYAVRVIHNERVFVQLERAKVEQGKLYRAVEALAATTSEPEVIDAGIQAARQITSIHYAAITLFNEANDMHEIRAVSGEGAEDLVGKRFPSGGCLVSMALSTRHPLPYRGELDDRRQSVFGRGVPTPRLPSLLVLPLLANDKPLGTIVLGSRRRGIFSDAVRHTLEVLASHMAVSLANARMVRRLEELATMDGMTGLLNKRSMLEVAKQKIDAARRFDRQLSVLVTDIDHFKKVNDTYGHDVGDIIIKGLGEILRREKRTTDAVARFGGEEFVVICEETDAEGAFLLAERVRKELEDAVFLTPAQGGKAPQKVKVTCSIGIATYPEAGRSWDEMFKAADEALYSAKRGGRNRTSVHRAKHAAA